VSGARYDRYGGDTACLEIRSERGDVIVVDAGTGIRCLGNRLAKERIRRLHLVFTHAHLDHIMGFPFFSPVLYQKSSEILVHGRPYDRRSYRDIIRGIMSSPYCPVEFEDIPAKLQFDAIGTRRFHIGPIRVTPIPLSHPNGGVGFRFEEKGRSFVFLTDNELEFAHPTGLEVEEYVDFCRNADLLIHDAEYTQRDYNRAWGHSVYTSAVKLGIDAGVKRLGMFHLNQKRTDDQVDAMVETARALVLRRKSDMECFAVGNKFEARLV
jgi:phosphoribosyl 1,2-cyclic phosphodiesterase